MLSLSLTDKNSSRGALLPKAGDDNGVRFRERLLGTVSVFPERQENEMNENLGKYWIKIR